MSYLNKISRIIIPVLLVLVVCYISNSTINQHYHLSSSGLILNHAHPYQDNGDEGNPVKKHNHSALEFIVLEQISNIIFSITIVALFLTPSLYAVEITASPAVLIIRRLDLYFLRNYRAPPQNPS